MANDGLAADFRLAAQRLAPRGQGTRYPEPLRAKAVKYLQLRQGGGVSVNVIAGELGVGSGTLLRWAAKTAGKGPAFLPVTVTAPSADNRIVVYSPNGLRIEGLDVAGLADLLRQVG